MTNDLEVHEEFLGLYTVSTIDAATLTSVNKDILLRTNISFEKLRGQCYDGASAMSGAKNGVAKQISDIEPRAIFSHCYGHALNLAVCDTLKKCPLIMDAQTLQEKLQNG